MFKYELAANTKLKTNNNQLAVDSDMASLMGIATALHTAIHSYTQRSTYALTDWPTVHSRILHGGSRGAAAAASQSLPHTKLQHAQHALGTIVARGYHAHGQLRTRYGQTAMDQIWTDYFGGLSCMSLRYWRNYLSIHITNITNRLTIHYTLHTTL